MQLTPSIAMSIVQRTMNLLEHNINIMDDKGIIIGSGDPSRISSYHQGAERVIEKNITVEIRRGNLEYFEGAREGVNLPIRFNGKPVGVVGITGDPDEVRTYGAMVQAMAELMLEESFYWEQESIIEQTRFSLVNDLIRSDSGGRDNTLKMRANILGYNLNLPRVAAVFQIYNGKEVSSNAGECNGKLSIYQLKKNSKHLESQLSLSSQDMLAAGISGRYILLKHIENANLKQIKQLFTDIFTSLKNVFPRVNVGVGNISTNMNELPSSFESALQAIEVGFRLFGYNQVIFSEELGIEKFVSNVGKEFRNNYYREILNGLTLKDGSLDSQLINTAVEFLACNLKPGQAAQNLFIHRNTLTYRIDKIKNKTGLDLNLVEDAFKFKLALMCYRFDRPSM